MASPRPPAPLARTGTPANPANSGPSRSAKAMPDRSSGRAASTSWTTTANNNTMPCAASHSRTAARSGGFPTRSKSSATTACPAPSQPIHSNLVVAIGPKCHVLCLDAITGELKWGLDMVRQFGATIPPWYTGQCPLIEDDLVILAPGGPQALFAAVNLHTGELVWTSPNPRGWKMTHASAHGRRSRRPTHLVYCASGGVAGVAPTAPPLGYPDWKISIATVPSPLLLSPDRVFLTGGYNAGSMMLQIHNQDGPILPRTLFRLDPKSLRRHPAHTHPLQRPFLRRPSRRRIRLPRPRGKNPLVQRPQPTLRPRPVPHRQRPDLRPQRFRFAQPHLPRLPRPVPTPRPGQSPVRTRFLGPTRSGRKSSPRP
jgi:hypothetical protein